MVTMSYLYPINLNVEDMHVVSAREFRTNQSVILNKAKQGESVVLTSRLGLFKITPITEEDSLTDRICHGLEEVKQIKEGTKPRRSAKDFLNEL